jgi:ketopantoate hydroxymethyltransferase
MVIQQGATFQRTVTWKDENGALINLTGYTARLQIRETPDATATIVSLTDSSGLVLGGSAGTIAITISATATAALTITRAVYDLELVTAGGIVTRLLEGTVSVTPEVSR